MEDIFEQQEMPAFGEGRVGKEMPREDWQERDEGTRKRNRGPKTEMQTNITNVLVLCIAFVCLAKVRVWG